PKAIRYYLTSATLSLAPLQTLVVEPTFPAERGSSPPARAPQRLTGRGFAPRIRPERQPPERHARLAHQPEPVRREDRDLGIVARGLQQPEPADRKPGLPHELEPAALEVGHRVTVAKEHDQTHGRDTGLDPGRDLPETHLADDLAMLDDPAAPPSGADAEAESLHGGQH